MIKKIAVKITTKLVEAEMIENDEIQYYIYAICINIEKVLGYFIAVIVGLLLKQFIGLMIFILSFSMIRKHAGGYHCEKEIHCLALTGLICFATLILARINCFMAPLFHFILAVAIVTLLLIGTVNNPNIAWDEYELKRAKLLSRLTVVMESIICFTLLQTKVFSTYYSYIALAIVISAVSIVVTLIGGTYEK